MTLELCVLISDSEVRVSSKGNLQIENKFSVADLSYWKRQEAVEEGAGEGISVRTAKWIVRIVSSDFGEG